MKASEQSPDFGPALILSLDPLGEEVAAWLQQAIFDRRSFEINGEHVRLVRCLTLEVNQDGKFVWVPTRAGGALHTGKVDRRIGEAGISTQSGRDAFQRLVDSLPWLSSSLEIALHDLRSHERLLASGLASPMNTNLEVFLLADLADPSARGVLLPLAFILQDLLAGEPYTVVRLVTSLAVFPKIPSPEAHEGQPELHLYTALKEINMAADPAGEGLRQTLAEMLNLDRTEPLRFPIFLFDRKKEGALEVKDREELQTIIGNFLLGLLSGGAGAIGQDEIGTDSQDCCNAPFSSAGAAALVFEPGRLIEACSARLCLEFINAALSAGAAGDPEPAAAAEALRDEILQELGDGDASPAAWMEYLLQGTPCRLSGSESSSLEFRLADLQFEGMQPGEWLETFISYRDDFSSRKLPEYTAVLTSNAGMLSVKTLARLERGLRLLPGRALLLGGGVKNASSALRFLEAEIENRAKYQPMLENGSTARALNQWEIGLEALQEAVRRPRSRPGLRSLLALIRADMNSWKTGADRVPSLPAWVFRLFYRWLHQNDLRLEDAKENCVRRLENLCKEELAACLREHWLALVERLKGPLIQAHEDLDRLERALESAGSSLEEIVKASFDRGDNPFRPEAVNGQVLEWAYERWHPAVEAVCRELVEQKGLLDDWPEPDSNELVERLMAYGWTVFRPVWDLTMEEIMSRREELQGRRILPFLAQGTLPLLRPNFDILGGGGQAQEYRLILAAPPLLASLRPAIISPSGTLPGVWAQAPIRSRRILALCRVRRLIPFEALRDSLWQGKKAYQELDYEGCREIHLFPEWAPSPGTSKSNGRY